MRQSKNAVSKNSGLEEATYTDEIAGNVGLATSSTAETSASRVLIRVRMYAQANIIESGPSAAATSMERLRFQTCALAIFCKSIMATMGQSMGFRTRENWKRDRQKGSVEKKLVAHDGKLSWD